MASATRSPAYPAKPNTRQKRVTVAGELPLRSASVMIVERAAAAGSARIASPTRRNASGSAGVSVRMRPSAPAATGIPFTTGQLDENYSHIETASRPSGTRKGPGSLPYRGLRRTIRASGERIDNLCGVLGVVF
ncbi:hypothetical protein GCM10017559_74400 [Streptosporangium longisporum]|uniref:Uncharacterized protein n=1 Tax=Streptosporangium longisporum TaxID=46187 RepID=A0ABP6L9N5_9ACTN